MGDAGFRELLATGKNNYTTVKNRKNFYRPFKSF